MRELVIGQNEAGQRFDKYLKKLLSQAPGSFIYKMLRKKNIVLNDKKADGTEKLKVNDTVKLYLSEETYTKFSSDTAETFVKEQLPEIDLMHLPFQILYEDADVLMINKPSGMLSQKAKPDDISANEYILAYLLASGVVKKENLNTFRPSICNRLDRNTSGVLIAGKTLKGLQEMSKQLRMREVKKFYHCIVEGNITASQHIRGYLRKDEKQNKVKILEKPEDKDDKFIETEYVPLENYKHATLLEVHLITGRTHQIRAHLASIKHPVMGDVKYGAKKRNEITSQLLHAYRLELENGEEIIAPYPKEFKDMIKKLKS